MKKFLSLLLAITLIFSIVSVTASAIVEKTNGLIGDANGDGKLSTADARFVLRAAAGIAPLGEEAQIRCDVDNDGVITIRDARRILRGAIGIVELEPHGAFFGFDGGEVFDTAEETIEYFNTNLNKIKASYKKGGRPSLTKITSSKVTNVELSSSATSNSLSSMLINKYKDQLLFNDEDNKTETEILEEGAVNDSKISVEDKTYVSVITAEDALGAVVSLSKGVITVKVSLPDTKKSEVADSGYSRILNISAMEDSASNKAVTILGYLGSQDGGTTVYKNGVFEASFDAETGAVIYYKTSFDLCISYKNSSGADLLTMVKNITTEYKNFGWPTIE